MTTFDLIGAIGLTAGAAILIGSLAASHSGPPVARIGIGIALAAWFALVVACGAAGVFDYRLGLGTPGLGAAVLLPVLILGYAGTQLPAFKSAVLAIPVALLIGVNFIRVGGVFFVLLHTDGRLPAPFAPVAGWGDVLIGATALPVAWSVISEARAWRFLALLWNSLGLLDLCAAIGLGVTSAEGSPVRLFFAEPSTAIMSGLPWVLIPAFIVPLLMATHLAVYYRLVAPAATAHPLRA